MSNQLHLAPALLTPVDAEIAMDSTADRCALLGADGLIDEDEPRLGSRRTLR